VFGTDPNDSQHNSAFDHVIIGPLRPSIIAISLAPKMRAHFVQDGALSEVPF